MNRSAGDRRLFRRDRNIFKLRHFNNCRGFHRCLLIIEELIVLGAFDNSIPSTNIFAFMFVDTGIGQAGVLVALELKDSVIH